MLKTFLQLKGVELLNKQKQKSINGGSQICYLTVIGGENITLILNSFDQNDPGASAAASQACADELASGNGTRCFYDCQHDGFESLSDI